MTKSTRLTIESGVGEIVLTQLKHGNPFDIQFNAGVCELACETGENPAVRAILIRAEGKYFSVGAYIKWLGEDRAAMGRLLKTATATLHMAIARFVRGDAPVVVAIHGLCTGGATALTAMADFAMGGRRRDFTLPIIELAL